MRKQVDTQVEFLEINQEGGQAWKKFDHMNEIFKTFVLTYLQKCEKIEKNI